MTHSEDALALGYREYGSLEGELESVHDRDACYIVIRERLGGERVKCMLQSDPHLLEIAHSLLSKRVSVSGEVCYSGDGLPSMILHVGHLEERRPPSRAMKDLYGALADPEVERIGSAAFLRKIRGYGSE